jgi:hypothetical protein
LTDYATVANNITAAVAHRALREQRLIFPDTA